MSLPLVACNQPEPPRLIAQPGCGIEDDLIDSLRVKVRGDFPDGSGTELRLAGGDDLLDWGDRPVVGVTVEGLFGEAVEAVGRTTRLREEGELPVYFARVDGLCPVEDDAAGRESVVAAVGPAGHVVIAGGRGLQGEPRNDVLKFHDEQGVVEELPGRLPERLMGHSVHALDEQRFVVVGGVSPDGTVQEDSVPIDLGDEASPIGSALRMISADQHGPHRAFHAGARSPEGPVLVTGGCRRVTAELTCENSDPEVEPSPFDDPHERGPPVLGTSIWIEPGIDRPLDSWQGPSLVVPRYGATLLFARDGVAYLVGGRDEYGEPVYLVERLRPGADKFEAYGGEATDPGEHRPVVVGASLLDGGLVLQFLDDGRVFWLGDSNRTASAPWSDWCEETPSLDPMRDPDPDPGSGPTPGSNPVAERLCFSNPGTAVRQGSTMPGERVLFDDTIVPVLGVGMSSTGARDLFALGPGNPTPPPRRVGAVPLTLADGSILLVGGRHVDSGSLATPVALRLRPPLEGPDEGIPNFDQQLAGSLIVNDPERVTIDGETVVMVAAGEDAEARDFPATRAHARSFRSSSFRFEVTMSVSGDTVPHLVLEHGGIETVSVALRSDRVVSHYRDAQGLEVDISCASEGLSFFPDAQVLRIDVSPNNIVLRRGSETIAQCPGLSPRPWSVGVGVSGNGSLFVSGLRLTRQ